MGVKYEKVDGILILSLILLHITKLVFHQHNGNNIMSEKNSKESNQTLIIVALISLIGVLGAALINSWDKIFHNKKPSSTTVSIPSRGISSDVPTATKGATPPTSSLDPVVPKGSNLINSSQVWKGNAVQNRNKGYSMNLYIEKFSEQSFVGKIHWPELQDSITKIDGEVVSDFGSPEEKSKWKLISGVDTSNSSECLTFTEKVLVQGSVVLNGKYYACIQNGAMKGIYFLRPTESLPRKEFTLFLEKNKNSKKD